MKKTIYLLMFFLSFYTVFSQNWTWKKGPKTTLTNGVYGTIGVASSSVFPGSRHGSASWTDLNGNLWLHGGEGHGASGPIGWVNDLWKYNPTANQWMWVAGTNSTNVAGVYGTQGVSAPGNMPGGREFATSWIDASGNFWLFGGDGWDASGNFGHLCDLWKYNPSSNLWTWMHGSNLCNQNGIYGIQGSPTPINFPSGRMSSPSVIDASGNLWLFGGFGYPEVGSTDGYLNDLWKYDPASNQWTWMKGTNSININGIYGVQGFPAPANYPGGREFPSMWIDGTGNFWLFGGSGYPLTGGLGYLNDLWKYSPTTNRWAWINGPNTSNGNGTYGTLSVPSSSVIPGARCAPAYWKDNSGKLWIFGGMGFPASTGVGRLDDMFCYDPTINQWSWMKGNNTFNNYGSYGTIGVTSNTNNPGSRYYNTFWKDAIGNFWLMGGNGWPETGVVGNLCDLWKYTLSCTPDNVSSLSSLNMCTGNSTSLTAVSSGSGTINWYNSPGGSVIGTGTLFTTPNLTTGSTPTTYNYYVAASGCSTVYLTPVSVTVNPTPTVTIVSSSSLICVGQTATLTAGGANTYTWSGGSIGNTFTVSPSSNTTYTVNAVDTNGCVGFTTFTQFADPCMGIHSVNNQSNEFSLYPIPNNGKFTLVSSLDNCQFELYDALGNKVYYTVLNEGSNKIEVHQPNGIYYYVVKANSEMVERKKMILIN